VITLRSHPRDWLAAVLAGVFYSLTFAPGPLPQWLLPAVQLGVLAWLARTTLHAPTAQHAAWRGWFFGLGTFTVGLYWLTISMSLYGGMPWVLSAAALLLLSAYLALFPALALWFTRLISLPKSALATARFHLHMGLKLDTSRMASRHIIHGLPLAQYSVWPG